MGKQMKTGGTGFYILILIIIFTAVYFSGVFDEVSENGYNIVSFEQEVKEGRIASVEVRPNEEVPTGEISIVYKDKSTMRFYVSDVTEVEEIMQNDSYMARRYSVADIQKPSWVLTTLLPYGLGIIAIYGGTISRSERR